MAKIKRFDDGGLASLGDYASAAMGIGPSAGRGATSPIGSTSSGKGGPGGSLSGAVAIGGGSASDGLGQITAGSQTVSDAINRAQGDLGGGGGQFATAAAPFKKGGSVKKRFDKKINLSHCGVSTSSKNKKQSNW